MKQLQWPPLVLLCTFEINFIDQLVRMQSVESVKEYSRELGSAEKRLEVDDRPEETELLTLINMM